ncbi:MAG: metal-dependent hydrolase [Andreesenia angusta]|nr:metal-dependent hydrolase [Andreesenia angusta]
MDPITHGIIGIGIAAMSGETELISPLTIGAVIGAMSPDIDILAKYRGNYEYLKHHRGETHSIFSVVGISIVISTVLNLIFPEYNFLNILLWTFLGAMSHVFFDALNSYGVRPLLPFKDKKYVAGLIMLYDPFISLLSIGLFYANISQTHKIMIGIGSTAIYLAHRYIVKKEMFTILADYYELNEDEKLYVLPSLINIFKWDYIVEKQNYKVRGRINFLNERPVEIERFYEQKDIEIEREKIIQTAYNSELGRYFDEFTSSINHVDIVKKDDQIQLDIIDLRYYMNDDYMHHASFIYDENMELKKSVFRPYKYEKGIIVSES